MRNYSFITTDGPDTGRTFTLKAGTTIIGRRDTPADGDPPESHRWVLTDPAVSRTHARVDWDGSNTPILRHLSSTNATLLEGRIVDENSAKDGLPLLQSQKVRLGQTCLKVEISRHTNSEDWYLLERGPTEKKYSFADSDIIQIDGLQFCFRDLTVVVNLEKADSEAYLIRKIQEQFWTTDLKANTELKLVEQDVIQSENKKLVLCIHNV